MESFAAAQSGKTLAVLHFEAFTDARDVEFVLGRAREPSPSTTYPTQKTRPKTDGEQQETTTTDPCRPHRARIIWCLDSNQQCNRLSLTCPRSTAIARDRCVEAFFFNDLHHYPRPDQPELWRAFKSNYLATANQILHHRLLEDKCPQQAIMALWGHPNLPQDFVHAIEARYWEIKAANTPRHRSESLRLTNGNDHSRHERHKDSRHKDSELVGHKNAKHTAQKKEQGTEEKWSLWALGILHAIIFCIIFFVATMFDLGKIMFKVAVKEGARFALRFYKEYKEQKDCKETVIRNEGTILLNEGMTLHIKIQAEYPGKAERNGSEKSE
jgi:hypothetical protein